MRVAFIVFAALVLVSCGDEPEVRTITETEATSDCLGDPRTPTCAAETILACLARANWLYCENAMRGDGERICRIYPELEDCRSKAIEPNHEHDPLFGFVHDQGWAEYEYALGLYDLPPTPRPISYRVVQVEPFSELSRADLVANNFLPDVELIRVGIDRWVCDGQGAPSPVVDSQRYAESFPVDEPGTSPRHWFRSQWRRLQTVLWEWGILGEPYLWVWYGIGADYCWQRFEYGVARVGELWQVVFLTRESEVVCEADDGCPYFREPPYRKIKIAPDRLDRLREAGKAS